MTTGWQQFFSYEKVLSGPINQLPVAISGYNCHFMDSNREWQDKYQQKHHIKVPGLTAITLNEVGWQGTASGDEAFQGEDMHINSQIVHRVVEYSTSLITITIESFLITHKTISAEYSVERLQCTISVGKCAGASHAYTWDHLVVLPCPWKLARSSHGVLDERASSLITTPSSSNSGTCLPTLSAQAFSFTGFPELALTHDKPHLPKLEGRDVHFDLLFRSKLSISRTSFKWSVPLHDVHRMRIFRCACFTDRQDVHSMRMFHRPVGCAFNAHF